MVWKMVWKYTITSRKQYYLNQELATDIIQQEEKEISKKQSEHFILVICHCCLSKP